MCNCDGHALAHERTLCIRLSGAELRQHVHSPYPRSRVVRLAIAPCHFKYLLSSAESQNTHGFPSGIVVKSTFKGCGEEVFRTLTLEFRSSYRNLIRSSGLLVLILWRHNYFLWTASTRYDVARVYGN